MREHNLTNNSINSGKKNMLSQSLRCQYLQVMGIQTWFDETLELPKIENEQVIEKDNIIVPPEIKELVEQKINLKNDENNQPTYSEESSEQNNLINNTLSLNEKIEQCELCELHTMRKYAVSGEGSETAKLFAIIDSPVNDAVGEHALLNINDKKMLATMLQTIGFELSSIYISSLVKCRPAKKRAPHTSEIICCDDHLAAQVKLIQPDVIIVLGEYASQQLLVSQKSLTDLRLRRHQYLGVPVFASYHPRELFGSLETKRKVWADLLQISKHIN